MLRATVLLLALVLAACAAGPSAPAPEPFAAFFARFSADTTFQRARLAEGFASSHLEATATDPVRVEARAYVPQTLDWRGPEALRASFVADDGGEADTPEGVGPAAGAVEYRLRGIDNGVLLDYRFVRGADGLWRLAAIDDHSM